MKKITKKHIKLLEKGHHDVLMDCFDFLLDSYNDDKYTMGYTSCLSDLSVRSYRLAEHIVKNTTLGNKNTMKGDFTPTAVDDLAKVIENYYTNALKQ